MSPVAPALALALAAAAASGNLEARVCELLRWEPYRGFGEEQVAELREMGDLAFPLVAPHLAEPCLEQRAALALLELDEYRAAPILFAAVAWLDPATLIWPFQRYNERLLGGLALPFTAEMRGAALACLDTDSPEPAALLAVGLTGTAADIPFLERELFAYRAEGYEEDDELVQAARSALARLGSEPELRAIECLLAARLPPVLDAGTAWELGRAMARAAFSGRSRFLPLLCRHTGDPDPQGYGDHVPPFPADRAAEAIFRMVEPGREPVDDAEEGRLWCEARGLPVR